MEGVKVGYGHDVQPDEIGSVGRCVSVAASCDKSHSAMSETRSRTDKAKRINRSIPTACHSAGCRS
jgi:hypothetical protein